MSKLVELLNKNILTLIVALPKADPEMAQAAAEAGADALQLEIDSLDNLKAVKKIAAIAKVPVGVTLAEKEWAKEREVKELSRAGIDFVNVKIDHLPERISNLEKVDKVLALNSRFTIDVILSVGQYGADVIDAAIIPTAEYGKELVVGDLQNYISIVISAGIPVIIPTQRSIRTSEVAIISDTGAKGLLLTSVVTGETAKHIAKAVKEYRVAVDDLG